MKIVVYRLTDLYGKSARVIIMSDCDLLTCEKTDVLGKIVFKFQERAASPRLDIFKF